MEDEDTQKNPIEQELPKNPLSARIWASMYRDASLPSQIIMLKEIMVNLGVSFIKAGDTTLTGEFDWSLNEQQIVGSISSCMLNSLGYTYILKEIHQRCANVVKILLNNAVECPPGNRDIIIDLRSRARDIIDLRSRARDIILIRGMYKNSNGMKNGLRGMLCAMSRHVRIDMKSTPINNEYFSFVIGDQEAHISSKDLGPYLKDIIENDELYTHFLNCWKTDEVILERNRHHSVYDSLPNSDPPN